MSSDYRKIASRALKSGKQIAKEARPSPTAQRSARTINDYAKMSPADASGKTQLGRNIFAMKKDAK